MEHKDHRETRSCWALQAIEKALISSFFKKSYFPNKVLFQDHFLSTKNAYYYWIGHCVFCLSKIPCEFILVILIHTQDDMGFY